MSAFHDFDAARAERVNEPYQFKLAGEMFSVPRDGDVMPLLDMAATAAEMVDASVPGAEVDPKAVAKVMAGMVDFITGLVADGDRARFMAALRRFRPSMDELSALMSTIMEGVVGRPLDQPSVSPVSSSETGAPLKVVSLSEGTVDGVPVAQMDAANATIPSSV
jgi:hypothetical protein